MSASTFAFYRERSFHHSLLLSLGVVISGTTLSADVKLPSIISNHMVLQKSANVPIWGKADPGEEITVTLGQQAKQTKTDSAGKWKVELNLAQSPSGPVDLIVSGRNLIKITDVLVGEVWLASGQSNMELTLKNTIDAEKEIAQSANPELREFHVKNKASPVPLEECEGQWVIAGPDTSGGFSGVGYYFAKKIQHDLRVPVGIIHSSWGATPVEAWTSRPSLNKVPALKATTERHIEEDRIYADDKKEFAPAMETWLKQHGREDRLVGDIHAFADLGISTQSWIPVQVTGPVSAPGLPLTGAIWLRREYAVTAEQIQQMGQTHHGLGLDFGDVTGFETIYWNGEKIGETTVETYPGHNHQHHYNVPTDRIKEGANVLALRIFAPVTPPAFIFNAQHPPAALSGNWFAKVEFALPDLTQAVVASAPKSPVIPWPPQKFGSYNFNGMINPLLPYAIKGAIWYQGEGNVTRAYQYRTAFPLLVEDWRQHWARTELPFYFCQLANFYEKATVPGDNDLAELREAQSMTLRLPHTGQAVLIDIGEANDIHPRNKKDAGERLALIALAKDYGKAVTYSGPVYAFMKTEGDKICLTFTHADQGLVAKPLSPTYDVRTLENKTALVVRNSPHSELEGFTICGVDRKWVWADAKIKDSTVVVWAKDVLNPVAVRYAWSDNPTCNLYNGAGLPASPFRTDDFPGVTEKVTDW